MNLSDCICNIGHHAPFYSDKMLLNSHEIVHITAAAFFYTSAGLARVTTALLLHIFKILVFLTRPRFPQSAILYIWLILAKKIWNKKSWARRRQLASSAQVCRVAVIFWHTSSSAAIYFSSPFDKTIFLLATNSDRLHGFEEERMCLSCKNRFLPSAKN